MKVRRWVSRYKWRGVALAVVVLGGVVAAQMLKRGAQSRELAFHTRDAALQRIEVVDRIVSRWADQDGTAPPSQSTYWKEVRCAVAAVVGAGVGLLDDSAPAQVVADLTRGDTASSERFFLGIAEDPARQRAEVAEAYRHHGALALLHDQALALQSYRQAIALDSQHMGAYALLAQLLAQHGAAVEALRMASEAGVYSESLIQAFALRNLSIIYIFRDEDDKAEEYLRRSAGMSDALGDEKGAAGALANLCRLYERRGQSRQAQACLLRELRLLEFLGEKAEVANRLGRLAALYASQEQYGLATQALHRSMLLCEELGEDKGLLAFQLAALGDFSDRHGELQAALGYFLRALELEEELGRDAPRAAVLTSLASVYRELQDSDEVLRYGVPALALNEALGDQLQVASVLETLGLAYRAHGQLKRAEEHLLRSLAISRELEDMPGVASSLANLGLVSLSHGKREQAHARWAQSIDLYKQLNRPRDVALVQGWLRGN